MWIRSLLGRGSRLGSRDLPETCFISHAYGDESALEYLLECLPKHVKPFIFPPISAGPDQMVSNELVSAILSCPGLIYLGEGRSLQSFWVTFERDYALRAGKQVYEFSSRNSTFRRDTELPPKLAVFSTSTDADHDVVDRVLTFMRDERYFELATDDLAALIPAGDYEQKMADIIRADGYVIA